MRIHPLGIALLAASAAASAQPAWLVGLNAFHAGKASPNIKENDGPPLSLIGGTLVLRLDNTGTGSLQIKDATIAGVPIEQLLKAKHVSWWRQRPEIIAPNTMGVVEICADSTVFPVNPRKPLALTLTDQTGAIQKTSARIQPEKLAMSYFYKEADQLILYLRNDDPWQSYQITTIRINGVKQKPTFNPETINPMRNARVVIAKAPLPSLYTPIVMEVDARLVNGKSITLMHSGTPIEPRFPIGNWQAEELYRKDPAHQKSIQNAGVDSIFTRVPELIDQPAYQPDVLKRYGVVPMTIPEPWQGEYSNTSFIEPVQKWLDNYKGDPAIIAFDACEEPDWEKPEAPYSNAYSVVGRSNAIRRANSYQPVCGTLCRSRRFWEFAPVVDIPIMDAYRVGAPSADSGPYEWGNYLESVADYTRDLKANSEPQPSWVWAQGLSGWTERMWVNGKFARPVPSPAEARAQLYMNLGEAAKGVFWFRFVPGDYMEQGYRDDLKKNAADYERWYGLKITDQQLEEAFKQYRIWWDELWNAMVGMNTEMRMLRPILSRADRLNSVLTISASTPTKLYASAVATPEWTVLFAVNLDYKLDPMGYQFSTQNSVEIFVPRESWMTPANGAWLLHEGKWSSATLKSVENGYRIKLPKLVDGAIVVIGDKAKRRSLRPSMNSILP